jgi:hypothetical protein
LVSDPKASIWILIENDFSFINTVILFNALSIYIFNIDTIIDRLLLSVLRKTSPNTIIALVIVLSPCAPLIELSKLEFRKTVLSLMQNQNFLID